MRGDNEIMLSDTSENKEIAAKCERHAGCDTDEAHPDLTKLSNWVRGNWRSSDKSKTDDKEHAEFELEFVIL